MTVSSITSSDPSYAISTGSTVSTLSSGELIKLIARKAKLAANAKPKIGLKFKLEVLEEGFSNCSSIKVDILLLSSFALSPPKIFLMMPLKP